MYKLENEKYVLTVSEVAAEMHSFKNKETGLEYLYDGDPAFWKGRNPTLFPMVGSTWNKEIIIDGKNYTMGNHGFCRSSVWDFVKQTENSITFKISDSEETLKQYPFHFDLFITYTLTGSKIDIDYEIVNKETDKELIYNFGLHPAFKCPIEEGEKFEDYKIVFECDEDVESVYSHNYHVGKEIQLNYEIFKSEPTVVVPNPKSTYVVLTNGKHSVKVEFKGYKWVAFWTIKENAPFVCIEPWLSHADFEEVHCKWEEREGTQFLAANSKFNISYSIEVL